MRHISPRTLHGEIIGPERTVRVVVAPHPLRNDRVEFWARPGSTVAEVVDEAFRLSGTGIGRGAVVYVGMDVVPEAIRTRVRLKAGATVVVRATVAKHATQIIATVLTVVVAIAAAVVAGPLLLGLGIVGIGTGIAAGSALGIAITGAVVAGITIGGALAINALFPIRPATTPTQAVQAASQAANTSVDASTPTYAIGGSQNQQTPFGPVPAIFGQHRVSPNYGAAPYTEIVGDDQYLRLLFVWGYGPLDVSNLRIGETPIESFADVQVETRNGYATDAPLTLFSNEVFEQALNDTLTFVSGVHVQVTAGSIDSISVDVTAPNGIYRYQASTGVRVPYSVDVRVRYWTFPGGAITDLGVITLTSSLLTSVRRALQWDVPNGQYVVELARVTMEYAGGVDTVSETVVWTALRAFRNSDPVMFAQPVARTAIRIRASSQLSGVIDTFNGIVQARLPSWSGTAWVPDTPTSSPADAFRAVLQGPANARPVADAAVDLDALQAWSAYCAAQGFTFNMVRDQVASVYSTLSDIAATGRAVPLFADGKWSVMWDQPSAPVVQAFTPRNSSSFSGSITYVRKPDAWRVSFLNATKEWLQDERIVYDDGFDATNAKTFEQISFPGVTDPDLIWRHGRFYIAQARLRPQQYTITADWQNIVCTRGDRVLLSHDVPEFGEGSGRVASLSADGLGRTVVGLDESVAMVAGTNYYIRFRFADGTNALRALQTVDGLVNNFVTLTDVGTDPAYGDLWMFGELGLETAVMRVLSVEPAEDLTATITLVDDAPAISTADTGTIPPFDSQISTPTDLFSQPPRDLQVQERLFPELDNLRSGASLSWQPPALGTPLSYEIQYLPAAGDGTWLAGGSVQAPTLAASVGDLDTGVFLFRIRALFPNFKSSLWATSDSIAIEGVNIPLSAPLPDVVNFVPSYVGQITYLNWDEVQDYRQPMLYELRKGATWDAGQVLGQYAHPHVPAVGDGDYWVKAFCQPVTGITVYSTDPAGLSIQGSVIPGYLLSSWDEDTTGWLGTESGGVLFDGTFPRTYGGGDILGAPDVLAIPDVYAYGAQGSGYYMSPDAHIISVGRSCPCLVQIIYSANGIPASLDFFAPVDFFATQGDIFGSTANQLIDVYPEIAISTDGATWGPWQRYVAGFYQGWKFKARAFVSSLDPDTVAYLTGLLLAIYAPPRIDNFVNQAVASGGTTLVFQPDNSATSTPFNGGPNGSALPMVQVTILSASAGDDAVVSSLSLTGCTVRVFNGGVGVARNCNIQVGGY